MRGDPKRGMIVGEPDPTFSGMIDKSMAVMSYVSVVITMEVKAVDSRSPMVVWSCFPVYHAHSWRLLQRKSSRNKSLKRPPVYLAVSVFVPFLMTHTP
jgi:hypothetical protein